MVSDISLGSTRLHNNPDPVGLLNAALDRGVNYIDASPDYAPESEQIIKAAIQGRDRDKLVIASIAPFAYKPARRASISAMVCSMSALVVQPASTPVMR